MDRYSWCQPAVKDAVLAWLQACLSPHHVEVTSYADLTDGHILYNLLQLIQELGTKTTLSRRNIPARPASRFEKINTYILGAVKIGSIYGLNVGAILNYRSEQELCKAAVLLLFLGSMEEGSSILSAGTSLGSVHQLALQDILMNIQNRPEPSICLDSASPSRTGATSTDNTTPPGTDAASANPQLSRLRSAATDSPLLAALMESPFTSSKKQTVFTQVRKLKLQIMSVEEERDVLQEDKQKEREEMSDEIVALKQKLTNLQRMITACYSQEEYADLEEQIESLRDTNASLKRKLEDYVEVQERVKWLDSVVEKDSTTIQTLQCQNAQLTEDLERMTNLSSGYKSQLDSLSVEMSNSMHELTEVKQYLSGKEEEIATLQEMVNNIHSKADTPTVCVGENLGDVLLMEAQGEVAALQEKLTAAALDHDVTVEEMKRSASELQDSFKKQLETQSVELCRLKEQISAGAFVESSLRSDINQLSSEKSSLETEYVALNETLQKLSCERDDTLRECDQLQTDLKRALASLQEVQTELDGSKICLMDVQSQLEIATRNHEQVMNDMQLAEKCNNDIREELRLTNSKLDEIMSERDSLCTEVERLHMEYKLLESLAADEKQSAHVTIDTLEAAHREVKGKLESLESTYLTVVESTEQLKFANDQLEKKISTQEDLLAEKSQAIKVAEAKCADHEQVIDRLRDEKSSLEHHWKQDAANLQNKIAIAHDEKSSLQESYTQVMAQLDSLRTKYEEDTHQNNKQISELQDTGHLLVQGKMELAEKLAVEANSSKLLQETLEKTKLEAAQSMKVFEENASKCRREMMEDLELTTAKLEGSEKKVQESESLISDMTANLAKSHVQIEEMSEEVTELTHKVAELEDNAVCNNAKWAHKEDEFKSQLLAVREANDQLDIQVLAHENAVSELSKAVETIEVKCADLEVGNERLQSELRAVVEEKDTLHKSHTDSMAKLNALCIEYKEVKEQYSKQISELECAGNQLIQDKNVLSEKLRCEISSKELLQETLQRELCETVQKMEAVKEDSSRCQQKMTEDMESTMEKLKERNRKIQEHDNVIADLTATLAKTQLRLEKQCDIEVNLSHQLSKLESNAESENSKWSHEQTELNSQIDGLKKQNDYLQKGVSSKDTEIHSLKQSICEVQSKLEEQDVLYQDSIDNVEMLTEVKADLEEKLQEFVAKNTKLESEFETLKDFHCTLKGENGILLQNVTDKDSNLATNDALIADLKVQLASLQAVISSAESQSIQQLQLCAAKESDLQSQLDTVTNKLHQAQHSSGCLSNECKDLHKQIETLTSEHATFAFEKNSIISSLEAQILALSSSISDKEAEIGTLSQHLSDTRLTHLQDQAAMAADGERLNSDICRLQAIVKTKCEEGTTLRREIDEGALLLDSKAKENISLQTDLEQQTQECRKLTEQFAELELVLTSTKQMLIESEERHGDLRGQLRTLCTMVQVLDEHELPLAEVNTETSVKNACKLIESFKEEHSSLHLQMQTGDETLASQTRIIAQLECDRNNLHSEVATCVAKLDSMKEDYFAREREHNSQVLKLQTRCDEVMKSFELKNTEVQTLQDRIKELDNTVILLQEEKNDLSAANDLAHESNHNINAEIRALQLSLKEANTEIDTYKAQATEKETALLSKINEQTLHIQKAEEMFQLAKAEYDKKIDEMQDNHKEEIKDMTDIADTQSRSSTNLQAQCAMFEVEIRQLADSNGILERELKLTTEQLIEKTRVCDSMTAVEAKLRESEKSEASLNQQCAELVADMASLSEKLNKAEEDISVKVWAIETLENDLTQMKDSGEQQGLELSQLKSQVEFERQQAQQSESQMQTNHQLVTAEWERKKSTLLADAESLKTQMATLRESNASLETKLATSDETSEYLERYKIAYKEKKKIIEDQKHEIKVVTAQGKKYKLDFEQYKERYEQLQAEMKAMDQSMRSQQSAVDESRMKMTELEATITADTTDRRHSLAANQRRRSVMANPAAVKTYGDDEADVLIDSTLKPGEGGSIFTEAAAAAGLLGESLPREEDANERIAEMMRRNARNLPHMRSAYPIESQIYTPSKARHDEIREARINDSDSSIQKKESNRTTRETTSAVAATTHEPRPKRAYNTPQSRGQASPVKKVLNSSENCATQPAASATTQKKAAEAFVVPNTPKQNMKKSMGAKLKGAFTGSKK